MSKFKDCPFCGGEAYYTNDTSGEWVECLSCSSKGPYLSWSESNRCSLTGEEKPDVNELWNQRVLLKESDK